MSDRYSITGRTFSWTTLDDEKVTIPLRVSMDTMLGFRSRAMDHAAVFDFLSEFAADQEAAMRAMDAEDFMAMYQAWRLAYFGGASEGESGASSS